MRSKALSAVVLAVVGAPFVLAQITYEELYREPSPGCNFAFARVQFNSYRARRRPGWAHDYPRAERNLLRILREVTGVYTSSEKHTVVRLDSPDIVRYPVLYFSELGSWTITPEEAKNFRSYLLRGGFAIIDDFDGPWDWQTLESCMAQVLPGCLGAQLAISVHNCPVLTDSRFPMSIFKRTQRKYVKKAYRVRNWREYEAGLRNRGSLTVWISLTAGKLVNWDAPRPRRRKPGRQRKYSNHAIETAVTLGMVFHLSSRQSEGLLRSLFALMKLDNDVPDHTTISRRKAKLGKVPFYQDKQKTPLHTLIDSSGLAVHAGQLRRAPKSRDYRKLHLCVDEQTGEVVAGELTSKRARDSSRVASLVGQIDSPISSARADTAYDASGVYEAIENHSAHRSPRVLIPPRKGAQLASGPASSRQRNRNIAAQARLGKRKWHTESGYSKRSKVETTFHRYKAIVGSAMRARGLAAQRVEARIGCKILNTMTALGMPDSEMIG